MKPTWPALSGQSPCRRALVTGAVAKDLTISIWGGGYAEEFKKQVVEPFEKETGATVHIEGGLSSERLAKLMATHGRGVDLIYLTDYQMAEAKKKRACSSRRSGQDQPPFRALRLRPRSAWRSHLPGLHGRRRRPRLQQEPVLRAAAVLEGTLRQETSRQDRLCRHERVLRAAAAGGDRQALRRRHRQRRPRFQADRTAKPRLQFFTRQEILQSINQGDVSLAPQLNIFVKKDDSVPLRFTWPKEGGLGVLNLVCMVKGTDARISPRSSSTSISPRPCRREC